MKYYVFLFLLFCARFSSAQDNAGYQHPPADIEKLVLATFNPAVQFNAAGDKMVLMTRSAAPGIEDLAQPELRIGGLRINPKNFSPSRSGYYFQLTVKETKTGKEIPLSGLPSDLKASNIEWNPAGNKFAFLQLGDDKVDLYTADIISGKVEKINQQPLNISTGGSFDWLDNESLFYPVTTASSNDAPQKPLAPDGPVIQENLGKKAASRTYQDLIKNKYDESLFRFYGTSQWVINKAGQETKVGKPDMYVSVAPSPDKNYLLVTRLTGALSYLVPYYGFEKTVEIWDMHGNLLKKLFELPSSELSPSGFDNVLNAPRGFSWAANQPSSVGWIEPLDGGNIKSNVQYHDVYKLLNTPFTDSASIIVKSELRMRGVSFINDELAFVYQGSSANQRILWQLLDLKNGTLATLSDRSTNDEYADPGRPFYEKNKYGVEVPLIYKDHYFILSSMGASPKGNYPYVSVFDFKTLSNKKIWQCEDPWYEEPVKLVAYKKSIEFITRKQSSEQAPNYYYVQAGAKSKEFPITSFPDPQPELRSLKKEKIVYQRQDGIQLTANLYVSNSYDPARDGKLPVIIVAYPREYKSSADAAQVRGSKNMFTQVGYGSFIFFALKGYAVLDNAEFPIVGEGNHYPNDNFVDQLKWNAKAAIDKIASMGIGDSTRVAVAGHSYGAFMTANLLAHTNYFKAGIARSGAYNRTLTPFGFQNEDRTYWEAPDIYYKMSPFSYADKIKTPLLMVHGEADNNPGTFPIQSERLFNAVKGHGGTLRFVLLPFESHGYSAKENILHLLWEEYQWLEKYVKNAGKN